MIRVHTLHGCEKLESWNATWNLEPDMEPEHDMISENITQASISFSTNRCVF